MRAAPLVLLGLVCTLVSFAPSASAAWAQPNRVTILGDSVLTAVEWNQKPLSTLEQGFPDMDLQIGVCRVLTGESCPYEGGRVPNLLQTVQGLGDEIGATVVVEVGYNDPEDGFGDAVDASIQALLNAGVQRILWLNYHVWDPRFAAMNAALADVAKNYPQVTIVDWQADSSTQYSWFQGDGIHLVYDGAVAMANLIHSALVNAFAPPPPPLVVSAAKLPSLQVGRAFTAQLVVAGGVGPYRWRVTTGPLGRGLHLLANGLLTGTPTRAGRIVVGLSVSDSSGESASVRTVLTIAARAPTSHPPLA
jgi:hypothetical protein